MIQYEDIYKHLLDLGKRNRLLNYKETGLRSINVLNKDIEYIFNSIDDYKEFSILQLDKILKKFHDTIDDPSCDIESYSKGKVYDIANASIKKTELICYKEGKPLDRVMKRLYQEYKFSIDEKGVNSLYFAFGFIKYNDLGQEFLAPILLIGIDLYKKNDVYKVKACEDDAILNPTLDYYFRVNKKIELPKYEDEGILAYFAKLRQNYSFEIIEEMGIGIFSFQKMNMYMDLKLNKDIALENNNIKRLLGENIPNDDDLNLNIYPVVDCDSTQLEAIKQVAKGKSFILEGPPGSGKSQTITNLIATLIGNGKKVLFVSEKQAALNVVYENLKRVGLSEFALELHSNKANKKNFIDEVYKTAILPKYNVQIESINIKDNYEIITNEILDYYSVLHEKYIDGKYSIYDLYNIYLKLDIEPIDYKIHCENYKLDSIDSICEVLDSYAREIKIFETNDYTTIPLYGLINLSRNYLEYDFVNDINKSLFYLNKIKEIINNIDFIHINNHKINSVTDFYFAIDYCHVLNNLNYNTDSYFDNDAIALIEKTAISYIATNGSIKSNKIIDKYDSLVLDLDLANIYLILKEKENSFFKFLNKDYKNTYKKLLCYRKEVTKGKLSSEVRELIRYKDLCKQRDKDLNELKTFIPSLDEANVEKILDDIKSLKAINKCSLHTSINNIKDNILNALTSYHRYDNEYLRLDEIAKHYNPEILDVINTNIDLLISKLNSLLSYRDLFVNYLYLGNTIEKIKELKLIDYIDYCCEIDLDFNNLGLQFKKNYLHIYLINEIDKSNVLYKFREASFNDKVNKFKELDIKIQDINVSTIISKNSMKRPDDFVCEGSSFKLLAKEYNKAKKQLSIRKLLDEIFDFIVDIKPIFLMSPLSVSTYLDNKKDLFDYVIFDEASQIFAWDAFGAIYRSKECVIIGDSKQLPPTNFFNASDTENEDEDSDIGESILSLASMTFISQALKWHYRSRSEELIQFSNKTFYNNSLITLPSANKHHKGFGIDHIYLSDGVYDLKTRTNRKEAEYISDLIIEHYKNSTQSLGVVAFSKVQAELISDILDEKLTHEVELRRTIEAITYEPLFIKNLESVQGDERDRIIFSICYGHNEYNKFYQRFGPLNNLGGEKRLNVAITRAKYNITVVTSIHSYEINTSDSLGANALKDYLYFCENVSINTNTKPSDNGIILSVKKALEDLGYIVDTNYGSSSVKIDLAVKEPNNDNYILAIMFDKNENPHVSSVARLEEALLNRLGFKYFKLYTLAWVNERSLVLEEILNLLKRNTNEHHENTHVSFLEETEVEMTDSFMKYDFYSIEECKDILNHNNIDYLVYKIVEREQPIVKDYLYKKIAYTLDKTKVSNVVKNMVNPLIKDFYCSNNVLFISKKDSSLRISSDRGIDEIPLCELEDGLYQIIKANSGITIIGAYKTLIKLLDFKRLTENTKKILDDAIVMLKLDGKIVERENKLFA